MSDSDLSHHFRVLKQFLDISDDSSGRNKSNSSRAARAREKLLKLSSAQFCELSTDVFDELKRRIDESRSEPDFLLPRSTFHPKRNQARQKLSSLPQSRFKDLVSDISYEIERRDLHKPASEKAKTNAPERNTSHATSTQESTTSSNSQMQQKSRASRDDSFEGSSVASSHKKKIQPDEHFTSPLRSQHSLDVNNANHSKTLSDDLSVPDKKDVLQKQAIGIQPTTVVPAKANMTWSSDEESDHASRSEANEEEVPRRLSLSNTLNPSRSDSSVTHTDTRAGEPQPDHDDLFKKMAALTTSHNQIKRDYEDAQEAHKSLATDFNSLLEKHNVLSTDYADLQTRFDSIRAENDRFTSQSAQDQIIKKELEDLKSANASLRLEIQSLKTEKRRFSLESREVSSPTNTEARGRSGSLMTQDVSHTLTHGEQSSFVSEDMSSELKKLHERLDQVPMSNFSRPESRKEEQLRNEVSQWQKKYESLKSEHILQSNASQSIPKDLKIYYSPNGVVPLKLAARFFSLTESFFLSLETTHPDPDLLFEKISSIAIAANKISLQGDHSAVGGNKHADTIRDAASHALTATRYYATHSNIMPKIIVERAVAEVSFSVCDKISVFKLHDQSDSKADTNGSLTKSRRSQDDDFSSMAKPLRITTKKQQVDVERELQMSTASELKVDDPNSKLQGSSPLSLNQSKISITPTHNTLLQQIEPVVRSEELLEKAQPNLEKSTARNDVLTEKTTEASPVTPPRPAKLSILDKMKQFEKPSASTSIVNKDAISSKGNVSSPGNEHTTTPETGDKTSKASKETTESAPSRSKSIFQSLKDRFTHDNTAAPVEEASESKSIKDDSDGPDAKEIKDTSSVKDSIGLSAPVLTNGNSASFNEPAEQVGQNFVAEDEASAQDESEYESASPKASPRQFTKSEAPGNQEELSDKTLDAIETQDSVDEPATLRNVVETPKVSTSVLPETKGRESSQKFTSTGTELDSSGASKGIEEATVERSLSANKTPTEPTSLSDDVSSISTGNSSIEKQSETIDVKSVQTPESSSAKSVQTTESASQRSAQTTDSAAPSSFKFFAQPKSSFKVKKVNYQEPETEPKPKPKPEPESMPEPEPMPNPMPKQSLESMHVPNPEPEQMPEPEVDSEEEEEEEEEEEDSYDEEEDEIRQRQDYRKSMAAATFNFDLFDIDDPDNTLTQVLLYLEHQTVQVISTIQDLLSAIKKPDATRGELRENSGAISEVIRQMTEATNTSMNQTRNHQLKEHGSWVVKSLDDCNHRMYALCKPNSEKDDSEFADRHFKQRLAGISFDIAKCTKELVKTVEEASLKEDIAHLDAKLNQVDDLT